MPELSGPPGALANVAAAATPAAAAPPASTWTSWEGPQGTLGKVALHCSQNTPWYTSDASPCRDTGACCDAAA
eukprot:CAMPEP_0202881744 /NCGR_PEP_ID=MMETSP1391-20130828/37001_1 /ASSEMBLY_ACC=CAM_ASM_000867 /TAXON_ID=1034604 /ORGANISM="Chlamydomonas leiostraca, Strain SAG 11-49" /LENGTH=72 /DNA_ID=CAMNT_0049564475 /DNA_START=199 /DNA_END=413 /DNA_ORIENTATION=-